MGALGTIEANWAQLGSHSNGPQIIDSIVEEVDGGAHRYPEDQASILKNQIINSINNLNTLSVETRRKKRNEKFLNMTSDI